MFNSSAMRALLTACSLLLAAGCSKPPIDRAQEFLDAGMASQAVPLLQVEIQANPKNSRAHFLLGQAALALSDRAAARESFDRAVLLKPNWADRVGRTYLDAASRLLADPTSADMAVAYLELARERTRALDKEIARSLRRLGLREGSPRFLRSAAEIDPALVQDDSVAVVIAVADDRDPGLRISAMAQVLARFPTSTLRPVVLIRIAEAEMAAGNRPKAKAYAQEAAASSGDPAAEAKLLLEQIADAEQAEAEAGTAARKAQAEAQTAMAQQRLADQVAHARAVQAQAETEAAAARAAAARREREAREQQRRQERLANPRQAIVGRWYFDRPPSNSEANYSVFEGAYIEIDPASEGSVVTGAVVLPAVGKRAQFQGALNGTAIEIAGWFPHDLRAWTGGGTRTWRGTFDLAAETVSGSAEQTPEGWKLRHWSARKR